MKSKTCAICMLISSVFGASYPKDESIPQTMTKIVVHLRGSDIRDDSFVAQPKTIYRAGTRYCRVEESVDSAHGIKALVVVNEPDVWFVNLVTKTGRHQVDSGPTLNCHLPLFADDQDNVETQGKGHSDILEFGRELLYFQNLGVQPVKGPILFEKPTQAYTIERGESRLQLFTAGTPERPVAVMRERGTKQEFYFYDSFDEPPFRLELFTKPAGVKIDEVSKPSNSAS